MSMPLLAAETAEIELPTIPHLRLADESTAAEPFENEPKGDSPADEPLKQPAVRVVEGQLRADDGAGLPAACVRCGDTIDLHSLTWPRGRLTFSICREHLIVACAQAGSGAMAGLVGLYLAGSGGGSRLTSMGLGFAFVVLGLGLLAGAAPLWTWRHPQGGRRLWRVCGVVKAEIVRQSR